ncbi:MAG TPA: VWA domain-containing protein [Pyrinomonadaceae bacterium]|jgi:Ca-activated chloride channel family protein|nr:VWA domain-containing protein [Pyrinomonadaceae bacterium]
MKFSRKFAAIVSLALILFAASYGQNPTPTPKITEEEGVIKVDSRLVVVPVSVTNANGDPVLGLTAKDFTVLEEGRPQTLERAGDAMSVPLEIALLFDVSASTDAMFRFQQQTAAKFLKDVLRPDDRAIIYTVGQKPVLVQGRDTADRSIASIMNISTTKGATAFFDTVRMAAQHLRTTSPEGRRRVILVISDGEDNFSEGVQRAQRQYERNLVEKGPDPDFKKLGKVIVQAQNSAKNSERAKVLRALQDADIVHYAINPAGSSYQLNQMSVFGQENMHVFSKETGGTAFLPKFKPIDTKDVYQNQINMRANTEVLERIFNQLANELRAQYLIQYYSDTDFPQDKFVKVNVGIPARSDLKVRAREGYYVKK